MMKIMIVLQWSLSLVSHISQSLMKPVELLTSGILFVELFQLLSSKEWSLIFFFYQLLFSPPLQDGINGLPDFALSSLHCLGLAVLTLWVLAYSLHSVSWNPDDHLAGRFRSIFGSVTAKIKMQSASSSIMLDMSGLTVGQAYMRFICLCMFCSFAFLIYLIIFPKWLKKLFQAMY